MNNVYTLLLAPRPAGEARATSIPGSMHGASNKASGPAGRSPEGRGGGRASAALPLLDDDTTSPASRRLASARPALAPKCKRYSLTDPNLRKLVSKRLLDFGTRIQESVCECLLYDTLYERMLDQIEQVKLEKKAGGCDGISPNRRGLKRSYFSHHCANRCAESIQ